MDQNQWYFFQGKYTEKSQQQIDLLTEKEILDVINNKNVSQIFLKDSNFKELLGDIKYDSTGRIIGENPALHRVALVNYHAGNAQKLDEYKLQSSHGLRNIRSFFYRKSSYFELFWRLIKTISGAGSAQMKFLTTVNVTAVKLYGTATRGEKIDLESYAFEGLFHLNFVEKVKQVFR